MVPRIKLKKKTISQNTVGGSGSFLDQNCIRARSKRDGTRAETRFSLSAKRTSSFKLAGGQFSRLLTAEVCASAVVMVVMLDTPCSEVGCKTTGYQLHSHVSPSLPLPCVTVCYQVSTELYHSNRSWIHIARCSRIWGGDCSFHRGVSAKKRNSHQRKLSIRNITLIVRKSKLISFSFT